MDGEVDRVDANLQRKVRLRPLAQVETVHNFVIFFLLGDDRQRKIAEHLAALHGHLFDFCAVGFVELDELVDAGRRLRLLLDDANKVLRSVHIRMLDQVGLLLKVGDDRLQPKNLDEGGLHSLI